MVFLPFCHLDHARFWAFFGFLGLFAIVGLLGPLPNLGNIESSGPFESLFGPFCTFWSFSATVVFFGQLFLAILALFVLCGHFKPFWPLDLFLATITLLRVYLVNSDIFCYFRPFFATFDHLWSSKSCSIILSLIEPQNLSLKILLVLENIFGTPCMCPGLIYCLLIDLQRPTSLDPHLNLQAYPPDLQHPRV